MTLSTLARPAAGVPAAPAASEPVASASQAGCSLLRMAVGDELLAITIEEVREILQVTRLTRLPRTPAFVRGVMNLRGAVVPVIDLAARLGRPATEIGRRSCIVVVQGSQAAADDGDEADESETLTVGLLVDAVFEVFDRSESEIEPPPPLGTRVAPEFLIGMTRAAGALVGVLALRQVLAAHDLAAAIAAWQPH